MLKPAAERLVEGTMRSIAKHGLEGITVTNIVSEAGLTRAMIMKSYGNKETLLQATAARFGENYFDAVSSFVESSSSDPKDRLLAMIRADLSEEVLNRETTAVWSVMRSLAHSHPEIRKFSTTRDSRLRKIYTDLISASLAGTDVDGALAKDLATATIAMLEGLWADYFLFADEFDRRKAENLVLMLFKPHWS